MYSKQLSSTLKTFYPCDKAYERTGAKLRFSHSLPNGECKRLRSLNKTEFYERIDTEPAHAEETIYKRPDIQDWHKMLRGLKKRVAGLQPEKNEWSVRHRSKEGQGKGEKEKEEAFKEVVAK